MKSSISAIVASSLWQWRVSPKPSRAVAERGVEMRGIERAERGAKAHAASDEALHDVGRDCVEKRLEGLFAHADFFRRDYGFRPTMIGESGCCARHALLILRHILYHI